MPTPPLAALRLLVLPATMLAAAAAPVPRAPGGIPAGAYATTLRPADVPADLAQLAGPWTVTFDSAGRYTIAHDGEQLVAGTTEPRPGSQVYLDGSESGPAACPTPATYGYAIRGDTLALRKVSDECEPRAAVLTTRPFVRSP